MKIKVRLLLLWLATSPLGLCAQGINDIVAALDSLSPYRGSATVTLSYPGRADDVRYAVDLFGTVADGLRHAPCYYLVETHRMGRDSVDAFAAYIPGRVVSYDGRRYSEYTRPSQLVPELVCGAPFAELLPQFIAKDIRDAAARDGTDVSIAHPGPDRLTLVVTESSGDVAYRVSTYTFVNPALDLLSFSRVSNPGMPAEMTLRADFGTKPQAPAVVGETLLMDRHGDIVSRFTAANRTPESFLGYPVPLFTLPELRGGRYTYRTGNETLMLILDDSDPDVLEHATQEVRRGLAASPKGAYIDVLYILLSRFADAVPASDASSGHERMLLGGASLAKEYGATRFPLLMLLDADGVVSSLAEGVNKDLHTIVIEMLE